MNKKFKRLLSAILAAVLVITGLQFGGWTQEAKAVTAGRTIYFDVNGTTAFYNDGATPVVLFKKGAADTAETVGDWTAMTYVKDEIYSAVIPEGATHVQFRRSNDTKSGSTAIELNDSYNYYQIQNSTWSWDWNNNLAWKNIDVITPAAFAGQTIYVTGNATVTLSDGTTVTGTQLVDQTGAAINVYKYTFGATVEEGTTFSIAVGGTTYVSGAASVDSAAPLYNTTTSAWEAYTEPVVTVRVYLLASDNVKVYTYDNDSATGIATATELAVVTDGDQKYFDYSVIGGKYIRVGWLDNGTWKTGNFTTAISKEEILEHNGEALAVTGTYTENVPRKYAWGGWGDASLDIPSGTFTKETGSYYVSTTFYDYYSDKELTGVNRSTLEGAFLTADGSDDKIQARTFNEAISNYFNGKLSGSFKPLYFGEFTKADQSYYLFDSNYNNVKGGVGGKYEHQGLIDSKLNSANNATMNGIELPYFNKAFLRGNNSADQAIGQVFENVQFPFVKNSEDYWEFDSAAAAQTLRMKQDSTTKGYYLDRVGADNQVKGTDSYAKPSPYGGFFPFNDKEESGKAKNLNYAFGARFDIPFTMTADGKYGDENNKRDIVYNFSGDDDVWVFIDGKLALDIGGDHGKVNGSINFATKQVSVDGNGTKTFSELGITVEANKSHTLTMFYMERGLWESNMKITFNFPQVNTFAVNMEVDTSNVNALFAEIVKKNLSGFDVLVQNYATRGTDVTGAAITETVKTYNSLDAEDAATISYEGSPEKSGIQTSTSSSDNKSGRENVLLVKYKAQLSNTADANGHRAIIKPEAGTTFDASNVSDYLQFDMYNEGQGSLGVPYVYLKDANGNVISNWASNSVAYNGNYNTLTRNTWVTVQVDLKKLKGDSTFDFSKITEIRIGYWDSGYTYIDNITFHKEATTETTQVEFKTKQCDVPTYGSIAANKLVNATGAIYKQQRSDDTESKSYVIGADGNIRLSDGDSALFTDQFRIGSYINLEESVNPDFFTTRWELSEGGSVYSSGNGAVIDDNRKEESAYAAENNASGTIMALNSGVTQPESALLYRSYARTDDVITPTHIEATYYNTVLTGSIKIQKELEDLRGGAYTFKITFNNIFGTVSNDTVTQTVTLNADNGYCYSLDGIPVGTTYVIEEVIAAGANYTVTNITNTGNDNGSADVTGKKYTGIISTGEDVQDVITFTNAPVPVTVDKVFFVEAGTETTLPMDLTDLTYIDEVATPKSSEEANIYIKENTSTGNVPGNVNFDIPYVNEYDETEPSKSVPNEKYTFTYSGKDNKGDNGATRRVTGTVTVYTFKAYDDVYVFDYGLKSDLADTASGNGLFQNDILFNENVTTIASFTGLKNTGDAFQASINNEQSTITGETADLHQIGSTNGASLDGTVIFQPTAFMDKVETFYYQASVFSKGKTTISSPADGVNLSASVKVMPASVVYYEDNFNATAANDGSLKIVYTSNSAPTSNPTASQSNNQSENYGYDDAYKSDLEASGGSCTTMVSGDGAYFTFTGTGFDIVSRTNSNTAGLVVYVFEGEKTAFTADDFKAGASGLVKTIFVDTFYSNGDLYQVPVISTTLGAPATYTVYLTAADTYTGQHTIYIDGVRIYNPLNSTDSNAYYLETEKNTTVEELRGLFTNSQISLVTETPADGTFTIDGAGTAVETYLPNVSNPGDYVGATTVNDVIGMGPNNELYMPVGTGIAFSIAAPTGDGWTLQIGAKSVSSDDYVADKQFTVWVKPDNATLTGFTKLGTYTINTSTDMYYDLDLKTLIETKGWTAEKYAVAIVNSSENWDTYDIISLTTIKHSSDVAIGTISQTTKRFTKAAAAQAAEPVIQSANFDTSSVTRGKYASMTVVTGSDVTDVAVYEPDGTEVTSFYKKSSSLDADGNKVWSLTFKVIKVKGDAVYSVKAVVDETVAEDVVSAVIAIR